MSADAILGLGTAVFLPGYGVGGQGVSDPAAFLTRAFNRGITYVDTAAGYGSSEDWLGAVSDVVRCAGVRVCTKLVARELSSRIPDSLKRLHTERVDTMLVHSAGRPELVDCDVASAMDGAKARGLIAHAGASTYGIENAQVALDQPWCDSVQVEFSILNPSVVRALAATRRRDQEIVVRSVLAQGMLTSSASRASRVPASAAAVLDRLEAKATDWGLNLEQLAIRFALDMAAIDVVLVGVANERELAVALSAAAAPPLDARQLEQLAEFDHSHEDWTHPERWTRAP